MSATNELVHYCVKIVVFAISIPISILLTLKDLKKRNQVRSRTATHVHSLPFPKKSNMKSIESIIAPNLHYISILLYFCCILQSVLGLLNCAPYVCNYGIGNLATLTFGYNKVLIMLFQIERLQLCFGKNCFLLMLKIIVYSMFILGIYYSFFETKNHFDFDTFYGCFTTHGAFVTLILGSLVLLTDWTILLTYFIKIKIISYRWNKLQLNGRSASSSNADQTPNNNNKSSIYTDLVTNGHQTRILTISLHNVLT